MSDVSPELIQCQTLCDLCAEPTVVTSHTVPYHEGDKALQVHAWPPESTSRRVVMETNSGGAAIYRADGGELQICAYDTDPPRRAFAQPIGRLTLTKVETHEAGQTARPVKDNLFKVGADVEQHNAPLVHDEDTFVYFVMRMASAAAVKRNKS